MAPASGPPMENHLQDDSDSSRPIETPTTPHVCKGLCSLCPIDRALKAQTGHRLSRDAARALHDQVLLIPQAESYFASRNEQIDSLNQARRNFDGCTNQLLNGFGKDVRRVFAQCDKTLEEDEEMLIATMA